MTDARRRRRALGVLAAGLALALGFGLALGSAPLASFELIAQLRAPRVLLAALVGGGLACAGALLQPLLRNPLADPYLLGISGGAALGAVLGLLAEQAAGPLAALAPLAGPLLAFAGALLATALLYAVTGGASGGGRGQGLLLAGVVFNAFASSAIVFLISAVDLGRVAGVFLWLIGSIRYVEPHWIGAVALLLALGLGVGIYHAYALDLLAQGDDVAAQLGVAVVAVRRRVLLATALMIAAAVSVSGLIGFVGLVVPHLLRLVVGADHRLVVPGSALLGAAVVVVADTLARTVLAPLELPVGAFTALLGGPVFFYLLRRELDRDWTG
jgi:iron complex transport system permease protein